MQIIKDTAIVKNLIKIEVFAWIMIGHSLCRILIDFRSKVHGKNDQLRAGKR